MNVQFKKHQAKVELYLYQACHGSDEGKAIPIQALRGPLRFQEVEAARISRQSAHEGDKVAGPTHRPP
jgi:hypothetical protein